jgi:hypothetical protein
MQDKLFSVIRNRNFALFVISAIIIGFIGLIAKDITIALAQLSDSINQNNSIASDLASDLDREQIVVTWLRPNETKPDNIPAISVSSQDFWKTFDPLLEQFILSNNYK